MATFKFDYAVESQLEALRLDPNCAMCEWGLGLAYGQNINDALVMALEPDFLSNEPLAYEAVARAQTLLSAEGGGDVGDGHGEDIPTHARDTTLVSALSLKLVPTVKEYESHFVGGLPASLSLAYAEAMAEAVTQSKEKGWPDHAMVLVLAADAWMNVSPWDCEFRSFGSSAALARMYFDDVFLYFRGLRECVGDSVVCFIVVGARCA